VLKLFSFTQAFAAGPAGALRGCDNGQTMAEYGVVLPVIRLAVLASITLLSDNVLAASRASLASSPDDQ
jgi:hypothetical protein